MKTISEIRREGIEALCKALGPDDTERFLSTLKTGSVEYTRDRYSWLPSDPDEIVLNIHNRQESLNAEKKE